MIVTAGLELDCITLGVGSQPPLFRCLTLSVRPGEIVTLIGSSGSGKSSLLSFLTGTLDPAFRTSGCVRIDMSRDCPLNGGGSVSSSRTICYSPT
jgi:putative thiamine transport system ATP-binding protein